MLLVNIDTAGYKQRCCIPCKTQRVTVGRTLIYCTVANELELSSDNVRSQWLCFARHVWTSKVASTFKEQSNNGSNMVYERTSVIFTLLCTIVDTFWKIWRQNLFPDTSHKKHCWKENYCHKLLRHKHLSVIIKITLLRI